MARTLQLHDVGRIPLQGDNVAIATRRLEPGTEIVDGGHQFTIDHTVIEGHRFTIQSVVRGKPLLSWGLPFGTATSNLHPGSYVCNPGMLAALERRAIDFELPAQSNFVDDFEPYRLDANSFQPAKQVARHDRQRSFQGYRRPSPRGVGTRNCIVLLGTSSRTSSYVRQLAKRFEGVADRFKNVDAIVPVAHTEGGLPNPNNFDYLLRVLSGFIVHPNVGAVLAVDCGDGTLTNSVLSDFMQANDYPLQDILHHFMSIEDGFQSELDRGEAIVNAWLDVVDRIPRSQQPVSCLNIALQCGGSDAFSGISGNPLASWVAKEIIQYGGSAVIAETSELVGAEAYMLQKVKDLETAQAFLSTIEKLKEWAAWHGAIAEGNVTGGNRFRGLYNIVLKSIGAARKRHPDVRLDAVIDYAEPINQPGFVFMNTPGNDIESLAGQVASGSNVILFVTGNGSITNFPFVPTIKIVTTSERYEILSGEMDVNAGEYLDGTPLGELARRTLELTIKVASGERSKGELAGHTQVQFWRDWPQQDAGSLDTILERPSPSGAGIPSRIAEVYSDVRFPAFRASAGFASKQVGLILPVSLCSGQIARLAAECLNDKELGFEKDLSGFVSLVHTEGCATSGIGLDKLLVRTLLGYATHPMVRCCLFLEHGCETNHNDGLRRELEQLGFDPQRFGWASVQAVGGKENVLNTVESWFTEALSSIEPVEQQIVGINHLNLGMQSSGSLSPSAVQGLAQLAGGIVASGGTVVVPEADDLLASAPFTAWIGDTNRSGPTLAYGERISTHGLHIMQMPSKHWVEAQTGLGATGVHILLGYVGDGPKQGHPMIPVIQVTSEAAALDWWKKDLDLILDGDPEHWSPEILHLLIETFSSGYSPRSFEQGNVDFQISRGSMGITL